MIYKNKFITIQEIWFNNTEKVQMDIDKVVYRQIENANANANANAMEFSTLLIDLTKDKEDIFQVFKKNNKYEINRAIKKDNLSFKIYINKISDDIINKFLSEYNNFSDERNRGTLTFNTLKRYRDNNCLGISTIYDESNNILVWHTYILIGNRTRLFTSNSFFSNENNEKRNLIGRANRLLHWEDILYFKENNFSIYDFGGWHTGEQDKKLLGINKFKESFGGYKEESYNYEKCLTFKCSFFQFLIKLKSIFK